MEDWLTELFFQPAETEQQKYDRKVAAARAADERRRDPPRNELDRAGRAIGSFFEQPAPPWYDSPEAFADLTQEEIQYILEQERRNPVPRGSPADEMVRSGLGGLGAMFKGRPETRTGEQTPKPGGWRGPVYDAAIARRMDTETKRLDLEMELLGQLVRSLEPTRKSKYSRENAALPAPAGFGSATMPYYSEFEGESWTDPEVQGEMEEKRFQQMMLMRNRPLQE